jgi:hypothetical protein
VPVNNDAVSGRELLRRIRIDVSNPPASLSRVYIPIPAVFGPIDVADDHRHLPGHPVTACRAVPVKFSTFLRSLRIPNPEITSATPRMTSQPPTTRASVTIESNG